MTTPLFSNGEKNFGFIGVFLGFVVVVSVSVFVSVLCCFAFILF